MLQISLSMMRTFGEEKYDYQKYSGSHMTENGIKIVLKNFSRKSFFSIFFNVSSSSWSFHYAKTHFVTKKMNTGCTVGYT